MVEASVARETPAAPPDEIPAPPPEPDTAPPPPEVVTPHAGHCAIYRNLLLRRHRHLAASVKALDMVAKAGAAGPRSSEFVEAARCPCTTRTRHQAPRAFAYPAGEGR